MLCMYQHYAEEIVLYSLLLTANNNIALISSQANMHTFNLFFSKMKYNQKLGMHISIYYIRLQEKHKKNLNFYYFLSLL